MARPGAVSRDRSANPRAASEPTRTPPSPAGARSLQLDRLIHDRMRLGILSALAVHETLRFKDLKALLRTTDGNLSVHARRLEEARYVACKKTFEGRLPKTEYRLTEAGRRAFENYLGHMEALIQAARLR